MTTALITHKDSLAHETPAGHPERVDRIIAIERALSDPAFEPLLRQDASLASRADLELAHPPEHIDAIAAASPEDGWRSIDADTHMSPGSLNAACRSAGGNVLAVDNVMNGVAQNAFVACRPPGHHAEKTRAMGFCFFGNVVIGARHALQHKNIDRVAIVDFDVHHGNGTQDLIWDDERVLFVSTHQMPLYPGTGATQERGAHNNIINIPLEPYTDGARYMRLFEQIAAPAIDDFNPDLICVSAGFDAHENDPLANINLTTEDFARITSAICDLADTHCEGRVVSTLEGGYDLTGLATSVAAHVLTLMERGK